MDIPGTSKNKHNHVEEITLLHTTTSSFRPTKNYARNRLSTLAQNEGRLVRTWGGGSKAVSTIRFSPNGKLVLSVGIDNDIKIWNVNADECIKIYRGHRLPIADICFSLDGSKFLSCSSDKGIICWDLERGLPISTFTCENVPLVVKFNPDVDKQNFMVAGMSNGRIIRWDIRAKEHNQVYDGHVGEVNSITFVERNKSFVSTAADKSLMLWTFEGAQVLNTRKPYEILSMSLHPIWDFLVGQTLDGRILVYGQDLVQIKHKSFSGKRVYDTYCEVSISPDGHNIMSGDSLGKCWFWDWHSCQVRKTSQCHEGPCLGVAWHPLDDNKYATCGSDGFIKLWSYDLSVADSSHAMVHGDVSLSSPAEREEDTENSEEINDSVSSALLMIGIATLLMTVTLSARTYIPDKHTVQIFGITFRSLDIFCTTANTGLTPLWWGLIMLACRIRPYRVAPFFGLLATLIIYWMAIEGIFSQNWFRGNVFGFNICLVVLVIGSLVRICSRKCKP